MSVLWIAVLLTVAGLDFTLRARSMTRRVLNAADYSVALAAADAGVLVAEDRLRALLRRSQRLALGSAPLPDPWREPWRLLADSMDVGEARVFVTLTDAGTRLHLNHATEAELRSLMNALRIDAGDADLAAQRILDWRDPDDLRRARGAEREEYLRTEALTLPANAPFRSVGELRFVLGVTPGLYERVAPYLTVLGSGRINVTAAPAEVVSVLPGMSDELLSLILRARAHGGRVPDLMTLTSGLDEQSREALMENLPTLLSRVTTETLDVLIRSEGWRVGASSRVVVDAVAVRSGDAAFVSERVVR